MQKRLLGKTGFEVTTLTFGAWQLGLPVQDGFDSRNIPWEMTLQHPSVQALTHLLNSGLNSIDTADVYGSGYSERIIGRLLEERRAAGHTAKVFILSKVGKSGGDSHGPNDPANFTLPILEKRIRASLQRLRVEKIDLVQLHCPPLEIIKTPDLWKNLQELKRMGLIQHYGISVDTLEEAYAAMEMDEGIAAIQVVYNMFRFRPAEKFFQDAAARNIGILCRQPLASGLLSGRIDENTVFREDDHRTYNRSGEEFDMGNTFAGVPLAPALQAIKEFRLAVPDGFSLAQMATRWVVDSSSHVTSAIGGFSKVAQAEDAWRIFETNARPLTAQVVKHFREYGRACRCLKLDLRRFGAAPRKSTVIGYPAQPD